MAKIFVPRGAKTMNYGRVKFRTRLTAWHSDKRGITGLETAIVLIVFVVVSSVFAFAALSTGLLSCDKAKETISAGLAETTGHSGAERRGNSDLQHHRHR